MKDRLPAIIATVLLLLFLAPYIWKLKVAPLFILLAFGVFLAILDFVQTKKQQPNLQAQQASYEEEST